MAFPIGVVEKSPFVCAVGLGGLINAGHSGRGGRRWPRRRAGRWPGGSRGIPGEAPEETEELSGGGGPSLGGAEPGREGPPGPSGQKR